jgi:hypothetical protein
MVVPANPRSRKDARAAATTRARVARAEAARALLSYATSTGLVHPQAVNREAIAEDDLS